MIELRSSKTIDSNKQQTKRNETKQNESTKLLINTNITQLKDYSSLCVNNVSKSIKKQLRARLILPEKSIFSSFKSVQKKLKEDYNENLVYSNQKNIFEDGKHKFSNKDTTKNITPLRSAYLDLPASGKRIFDYIWSLGKSSWVCLKNEKIALEARCSLSTVKVYKRLFIANGWLSSYQVNNTEKKFEVNRANRYTPCYFKLHISPYWFKGFKIWKEPIDFGVKALRSNQHQMPNRPQNLIIYINNLLDHNIMPKTYKPSKTIVWESLTKEERHRIRVSNPKAELGYTPKAKRRYSIHQEKRYLEIGKAFESSYQRNKRIKALLAEVPLHLESSSTYPETNMGVVDKYDPRVQEILTRELRIAKKIEIEKEVLRDSVMATAVEPSMKTMLLESSSAHLYLLRAKLTIQVQEEFKDKRANAKTAIEQDEVVIKYKKKLKDTFLANGIE